jgi:hypothetical protein
VGVDTEAQRKSLRVEPTTGQAQSCIKATYAEESLREDKYSMRLTIF